MLTVEETTPEPDVQVKLDETNETPEPAAPSPVDIQERIADKERELTELAKNLNRGYTQTQQEFAQVRQQIADLTAILQANQPPPEPFPGYSDLEEQDPNLATYIKPLAQQNQLLMQQIKQLTDTVQTLNSRATQTQQDEEAIAVLREQYPSISKEEARELLEETREYYRNPLKMTETIYKQKQTKAGAAAALSPGKPLPATSPLLTGAGGEGVISTQKAQEMLAQIEARRDFTDYYETNAEYISKLRLRANGFDVPDLRI